MYNDEAALIAGLVAGHDDAYRAAIRAYQSSMRYLAVSLVGQLGLLKRLQFRWHLSLCQACRLFLHLFETSIETARQLDSQVDLEPTEADIDTLVQRFSEANPR